MWDDVYYQGTYHLPGSQRLLLDITPSAFPNLLIALTSSQVSQSACPHQHRTLTLNPVLLLSSSGMLSSLFLLLLSLSSGAVARNRFHPASDHQGYYKGKYQELGGQLNIPHQACLLFHGQLPFTSASLTLMCIGAAQVTPPCPQSPPAPSLACHSVSYGDKTTTWRQLVPIRTYTVPRNTTYTIPGRVLYTIHRQPEDVYVTRLPGSTLEFTTASTAAKTPSPSPASYNASFDSKTATQWSALIFRTYTISGSPQYTIRPQKGDLTRLPEPYIPASGFTRTKTDVPNTTTALLGSVNSSVAAARTSSLSVLGAP